MASVSGKTIIVTGAASGIGAATADLLSSKGAKIIALDLKEPETAYDAFIQIDLSNPDSIQKAAAQIEGKADALCNIAGVPPTVAPIPLLQVNVLGLIAFTKAVEAKLNDNASIVNIASLAGMGWRQRIESCKAILELEDFNAVESFIAEHNIDQENCYEFSKEAIIIWTIQQWNSFGRGIRVNALSPSATQTPILQDFMETVAVRVKAKTEGMVDRPPPGKAEDIAPIIAFLCSDESSWLKGLNIPVDGGLFAAMQKHTLGF